MQFKAKSKLPCYLWTFVKHLTLSLITMSRKKLYHYGIRGCAYKLLKSYLSFRKQFVSVQNHHSSLKAINNGVPQRSILGPLLFLIYVNDIPNSVTCNLRLFADDTCLLVSSPSRTVLENECNKEINKLQICFSARELQINLKNLQ